jgi:hypothetical protein
MLNGLDVKFVLLNIIAVNLPNPQSLSPVGEGNRLLSKEQLEGFPI